MPDTKISGLASATSIAGTELVPIVQGGVNRNATPQLLQTQVYTERTLDFQIALTDRNRDQHINSASPVVCTIPLNATVAFDVGDRMDFVRLGAGTATIDAVSGVTLNGVDGDSIAIDAQYVWVRLKKVGTDAWQCSLVEGRTYTPATHATSHQSGGSDPIKLDDLAAPDDNTDLDATTSAHGLLPKLSGVSTEFLNGNGAFATPAGGGSSNTRWIGAGELIPRVTNGAGIDGEELATNDINLDYLAFDTGTSEGAQASFAWPSGFTTFTATFHWTAASGSGGVRWQCSARCYADDDALDQAQGTSQAVSDTFLAANDAHRSAATSAITPAGTASAGNLCVIEVERDPSHGDDTLAVDARLIGVLLEFAA